MPNEEPEPSQYPADPKDVIEPSIQSVTAITIFMGRTNQKIETNSQQLVIGETQKNQNPAASQSLDKAKKECEDIGLKAGSEQFGNCVLKLTK